MSFRKVKLLASNMTQTQMQRPPSLTLSGLNTEDRWKSAAHCPILLFLTPHPPGQAPSSKGWIAFQPVLGPYSPLEVCSQLPAQGIQILKAHWQEGSGEHVYSALWISLLWEGLQLPQGQRTLKRKLEQGPRLQPHELKLMLISHVCLTQMLMRFLLLCVAKRKVHPRTAISTWKLVFEIHCVVN